MTTVEMLVHMDCAGCVSKIRKALQTLKGVDNVEIDMSMQKVTVTGSVDQKKVLKTVRKTGRRAELWQLPYNPVTRNHNYTVYNPHNYGSSGGSAAYYATSQPPGAFSYNYYKHGYDHSNQDYAYFSNYSSHQYGHSTIFFGSRAGEVFSEESVHGCSIM